MEYSKEQIHQMMIDERYPLCNKYDCDWILDNAMGSHNLWLQESLIQVMYLKAGMRILDMGCGKAISSIFLAKELDVQVWATDLWISASDNWKRICDMEMADKVFPIHADAKDLPYADDFFDAMVSIISLFFYVKDESFLKEHILRHVKTGGEIGLILPCFLHAYKEGIPEELKEHWSSDLDGWYTLDWWVEHLNKTGMVDIVLADTMGDDEGNKIFLKTLKLFNTHEAPLHVLAGDNISFIRIVAKKK